MIQINTTNLMFNNQINNIVNIPILFPFFLVLLDSTCCVVLINATVYIFFLYTISTYTHKTKASNDTNAKTVHVYACVTVACSNGLFIFDRKSAGQLHSVFLCQHIRCEPVRRNTLLPGNAETFTHIMQTFLIFVLPFPSYSLLTL